MTNSPSGGLLWATPSLEWTPPCCRPAPGQGAALLFSHCLPPSGQAWPAYGHVPPTSVTSPPRQCGCRSASLRHVPVRLRRSEASLPTACSPTPTCHLRLSSRAWSCGSPSQGPTNCAVASPLPLSLTPLGRTRDQLWPGTHILPSVSGAPLGVSVGTTGQGGGRHLVSHMWSPTHWPPARCSHCYCPESPRRRAYPLPSSEVVAWRTTPS